MWITEWHFHSEYPFFLCFCKIVWCSDRVIYAKFLSKCDRQNYMRVQRSYMKEYYLRMSSFLSVRSIFSIWEIEVFFSFSFIIQSTRKRERESTQSKWHSPFLSQQHKNVGKFQSIAKSNFNLFSHLLFCWFDFYPLTFISGPPLNCSYVRQNK